MTAKRPTLADVANRAGTSTAVVSYVLNNGPRPVSESLRSKVITALDELNYRPDRNAQALRRSHRWRQIGLLVPDLTMPLFGSIVGRIEIQARARDHLTMIGNTGYDPDREVEFARAFTDVGIDGLIVVGAADAEATAKVCAQARVPVVWAHNSRGRTESPLVGADHVAAGALAVDHLVAQHDCADIVFVGGFTDVDVAYGDRETVAQRFQGFSARLGDPAPVIRTDLTAAGSYRSVSSYLRARRKPPSAMVIGTYGQSAAAMRAITDAGLRIPHDVRVVGFDADAANDYGQLVLTAVQQPMDAIAGTAMDLLLDDAGGSGPAPEAELLPATLRRGESCGCR